MKTKHILLASATLLIVGTMVSCHNEPTEEQVFATNESVQEMVANNNGVVYDGSEGRTFTDFRDTYMTYCGVYFPVRQRSYSGSAHAYTIDYSNPTVGNKGLFSVDTIPSAKTTGKALYLRGRVITDDYDGNFYKSLIIQHVDKDGKQQVMRLSVDAGSAGGMYNQGQEILLRVDGLCIGKYANQPQICVPSYNDNIGAMYAAEKVGWAPGRIPSQIFSQRVTLIGKPDKSKILCDTLTIADYVNLVGDDSPIGSNSMNSKYFALDGHLVLVKNAYFTQAGKYPGQYLNFDSPTPCKNENPDVYSAPNTNGSCVFAPTTGNLGFPQGRVIADGTGQSQVQTSEYAKFAHMILPTADYIGEIKGILGHYTDSGSDTPDGWDWSITLINRSDLNLRNGEVKWEPTVEWTDEWDM